LDLDRDSKSSFIELRHDLGINEDHATLSAKFNADLATEQVDETYARHSEPQHI